MRQLLICFEKLDDADFQPGSIAYQADFDTWGRDYARAPRGTLESPKRNAAELIVRPVHSRTTALAALRAVAEQGEGNQENESEFSHFQRFVAIFRHFKTGSVRFVRNIARNPVTMGVTPEPGDEPVAPIKNQKSLLWAQLFNTRYRLLLSLLAHALHAEGRAHYLRSAQSPRQTIAGAFGEMYQLRALAGIIVRQPIDDSGSGVLCGPPFELPYSLALPDLPSGRWKAHRDILDGIGSHHRAIAPLRGRGDQVSRRAAIPEQSVPRADRALFCAHSIFRPGSSKSVYEPAKSS